MNRPHMQAGWVSNKLIRRLDECDRLVSDMPRDGTITDWLIEESELLTSPPLPNLTLWRLDKQQPSSHPSGLDDCRTAP